MISSRTWVDSQGNGCICNNQRSMYGTWTSLKLQRKTCCYTFIKNYTFLKKSSLKPHLNQNQTNINCLYWFWFWFQKFCQELNCPVSGLAKRGSNRTKPNFPNTSLRNG